MKFSSYCIVRPNGIRLISRNQRCETKGFDGENSVYKKVLRSYFYEECLFKINNGNKYVTVCRFSLCILIVFQLIGFCILLLCTAHKQGVLFPRVEIFKGKYKTKYFCCKEVVDIDSRFYIIRIVTMRLGLSQNCTKILGIPRITRTRKIEQCVI